MVLSALIALAPEASYAQTLVLPQPGTMVNASPVYVPLIFKGLTVHPDNPILFDFIVDTGDSGLKPGADNTLIREQANTLVKYFLASLTLAEKDQWVNLSPYEKNRILPEDLGKTELGRDMLAEDYLLKQVTASFIHPDTDLGKKFWARVYARAQKELGTSDIPVDTFNKVWVSADKADVFVRQNTAFVVGSHLKVQLEADYVAMSQTTPSAELSKKLIREIVLPELEKEVNTGKNFARLRQIFHAMILATWYKKNLKDALLTQVYANRAKTSGVEGAWVAQAGADIDPQQIWSQYEAAYKQGVFNFIKEDINQTTGEAIPRKYFSGGVQDLAAAHVVERFNPDNAATRGQAVRITAQMRMADDSMAVVQKQLKTLMQKLSKINLSETILNVLGKEEVVAIKQLNSFLPHAQTNDIPPIVKAMFQVAWTSSSVVNLQMIRAALNEVTPRIASAVLLKDVLDFKIIEEGIQILGKKMESLNARNSGSSVVKDAAMWDIPLEKKNEKKLWKEETRQVMFLTEINGLLKKFRLASENFLKGIKSKGSKGEDKKFWMDIFKAARERGSLFREIKSKLKAAPDFSLIKEVAYKRKYLPLKDESGFFQELNSEKNAWIIRIGSNDVGGMLPFFVKGHTEKKVFSDTPTGIYIAIDSWEGHILASLS